MEAQFEALSELVKNGQKLNFGQDFFVKFYQAFLYSDRWQQYIKGVGTTLLVTAIALVLGVVLGAIVAMVRVGYAQQKPHHRNPILGIFNAAAQVYVTVIRGTPMMVQLLIMSMVIFASSRNFTMVGALALGINSGAYVSEIIRGGLMAVDPGQMEAGRSLGLNYMTTMFEIIIPQAIRSILPSLGNEFIMLLKDSSLITVIGGKELLYAAQGIMNRTYEPMFPLLGVAGFLFYMAGNTVWTFFANCINNTANTFVTNSQIFGKVYFPRLTMPVSQVLTSLINFGIQAVMYLIFWVYFFATGSGVTFTLWVLAVPFVVLEVMLLGLGVGIIVSSLTTKYRDLAIAVGFGVQLWMYASPVVYPLSMLDNSPRLRVLVQLNPMTSPIEIFRMATLGTGTVTTFGIVYSLIFTAAALVLGVVLFSRIEKTFMDTV